MKRIIALAILGIIMSGCASSKNQIIGVVLPTTNGHYVPWSADGKAIGGWTPTEEQLRKAQPAILEYIKKSDKSIYDRLENYRCQYFGITVNGRKRIHYNFFWLTEDKKDWRTAPVLVLDGGDRYFQLEYDVETGECLNFSVNGEA